MHQRAGPAGVEEAGGLPGVRQALHADDAAGCAHGFGRGRLRRLLPIQTPCLKLCLKCPTPREAASFVCPAPLPQHARIVLATAAAAG